MAILANRMRRGGRSTHHHPPGRHHQHGPPPPASGPIHDMPRTFGRRGGGANRLEHRRRPQFTDISGNWLVGAIKASFPDMSGSWVNRVFSRSLPGIRTERRFGPRPPRQGHSIDPATATGNRSSIATAPPAMCRSLRPVRIGCRTIAGGCRRSGSPPDRPRGPLWASDASVRVIWRACVGIAHAAFGRLSSALATAGVQTKMPRR